MLSDVAMMVIDKSPPHCVLGYQSEPISISSQAPSSCPNMITLVTKKQLSDGHNAALEASKWWYTNKQVNIVS